ncbi:hypothetical protein A8H39_00190 [Paraburkholderia fungorum]|uniref:hypothetical protein n=1 Tax=Paraburkholderia fungorum TaxID=134537 RepID=UPI0004878812|nr:hypothetical protein [Paraburkholderia fungorum]PNE59602.1 hypothetical protein A8H39_00190 [Paraburkholderia fungorum]
MDTKFCGQHEAPEVDIGGYGHSMTMYVYQNEPAETVCPRPGDTRAYLGSKLAEDALLVGFSSQRGGGGTWLIAPMSPTDAAKYAVDSTVTLHYRKPPDDRLG